MQAHGSITIVDLLDTATYIYYSANSNGTGATKTPAADSKYIGIYSGPPVSGGQPTTPPNGTIWSKYSGEDGKNGAGFHRIITKVRQFTQAQWNQYNYYGHSENWSYQTDVDTPTSNLEVNSHIKIGDTAYITGVITDRDNLSCMLIGTVTTINSSGVRMTTTNFIVGEKGEDGEPYIIESNRDEILFFYGSQGYYPSTRSLSFSVKLKGALQTLSSSACDICIKNNENFQSILKYANDFSNKQIVTIDLLDKFYNISEDDSNKTEKQSIWNLLIEGTQIKFLFKKNNIEVANKIINVRRGVNDDMAKFSINAADISAAIQEAKMEFSAEGLKLTNGTFSIVNDKGESLLGSDDGNLILKGNIQAKGGSIGGFDIYEDRLLGKDGLALYGQSGLIEAKNIILGEGAQVSKYILFTGSQNNNVQGQAYLYNPTHKIINSEGNQEEIGLFIKGTIIKDGQETTTLKIFPNGNAQFGEITIDSENSILSCGNNWSLGTSTATFKNIVASGSIKTAVFEKGTVQAIGGAFLVMTSHNIKSYNKNNLSLTLTSQASDLTLGHTVWLIEEGSNIYTPCTIQSITQGTETSLTVQVNAGYTAPNGADVMIVVGDTVAGDPLIMGISNISSKTGENLIYPYGLTINNYKNKTGNPKLFLGDLAGVGKSGYGLYSDNVYLNGSLTTKSDTGTYAGVNTSTGVNANIFSKFNDGSKIIFWAGASSAETASIQGAPFQVTEAGSIYARRAELTDSIFINGTITGADIYAARIHGNGGGDGKALKIYDTSSEGGIGFYRNFVDNSNEGEETCRINSSGFYAQGEVAATFESGGKTIKLSAAGLFNSNTGIELSEDGIKLKTGGAESFLISNNKIVSKVSLRAENEIRIGSSSNSLQAKLQQVDGGYDLYITGES